MELENLVKETKKIDPNGTLNINTKLALPGLDKPYNLKLSTEYTVIYKSGEYILSSSQKIDYLPYDKGNWE